MFQRVLHPLVVRLTHWLNAVAVIGMIGSGWQIYNASPILPFTFPGAITIGGWLGGALLWHFAAMWLVMANLAIYLAYGLASGRLRHKLLPLSLGALVADLGAALRFRLAHQDLSRYNAVQRAFYLGVIAALVLVVLSGLAIWKPVQTYPLELLFGGFQGARLVHFLAMCGIVLFLCVHIALVALVPSTLRAMVLGRSGRVAPVMEKAR